MTITRGTLVATALLVLGGMCAAKKLPNISWSYIDRTGKPVQRVNEELQVVYPREGLVPSTGGPPAARWGYHDRSGTYVIPRQYGHAGPFVDRLAVVEVVKSWEPARGAHHEIAVGGRYGFVNPRGKLVIKPVYDSALSFSEGLAAVKLGERAGFIDPRGKRKIPFAFQDVRSFSQGLAPVRVDDRWGFVDHKGALVIKPAYDAALEFAGGFAAVLVGGKWGYVDRTGAVIVKPTYVDARSFSEGRAAVCTGVTGGRTKSGELTQDTPHWGFVDTRGKLVIRAEYQDVGAFSRELTPVMKTGPRGWLWGYIDASGKIRIAPKYHQATAFNHNGLARVGFIIPD